MNKKKIVKFTTMVTAGTIVVTSAVTPVGATVNVSKKEEKQTEQGTQGKTATSLEEAKQNLEEAKTEQENAVQAEQKAGETAKQAEAERVEAEKNDLEAEKKAEQALQKAESEFQKAKDQAKQNQETVKQEVATTQKNVEQAIQDVKKAETAYQNAQSVSSEKKQLLEQVKQNTQITEQEVTNRKNQLDLEKKKEENAKATIEEAKKNVNSKKAQVEVVKAEIQKTQSNKEVFFTELVAAESELKKAEEERKQAEELYIEAQKEVETTSPEYQEALRKVEAAKQALDTAYQKKFEKQKLLEQTAIELENAKNMQLDNQNGITEAEKQIKIAETEQKIAILNNEIEQLSQKEIQLQEEINQARETYDSVHNQYNEMLRNLKICEEKINRYTELCKNEEINVANRKNELEKVEEVKAEMMRNLKKAEEEYKTAEHTYQEAQKNVLDAQTRIDNAKKLLEEAQKEYEDAMFIENEVNKEVQKGSLGFFASVGAQEALDVFKKEQYKNYTVVGDPADATALTNMKETLRFMKECNEIRKKNNLSPLKVTDYMMAVAQYQTNYSNHNVSHSGAFNVGENLAWNADKPFESWYNDEKKMYDEGERDFHKIGHYLNIITPEYQLTGYAIAKKGVFPFCHGQVFSANIESLGESFTVEEYEARFMKYYDSLFDQKKLSQAALKKIEEGKQELNQAIYELDKNKWEEAEAKKRYDFTKTQLELREKSVRNVEQHVKQAKEQLKASETTLNEYKGHLTTAEKNRNTIVESMQKLKAEEENVKKILDAKYTEYNAILKKKTETNESYNVAQQEIIYLTGSEYQGTLEEANHHFNEVNAVLQNKKEAKKRIDQTVADKQKLLDQTRKEFEASENDIVKKTNALKACEEEKNRLEATLTDKLAQAGKNLALKEEAMKQAQAVVDQKRIELESCDGQIQNSSTKLEIMQKELAVAEKNLVEKKLELENAKKAIADAEKKYDEGFKELQNLKDVQREYDEAEKATSDAKKLYDEACVNREMEEKKLKEQTSLLERVEDKKNRVDKLSVEEAKKTPIKDEDFLYLNQYIDALKVAEAEVEATKKALAEKEELEQDAKKAYEEAKKRAERAEVNLTIVQAEYDKFLQEQKPDIPLTPIEPSTPVEPEKPGTPLIPLEPSKPVEKPDVPLTPIVPSTPITPEDNHGSGTQNEDTQNQQNNGVQKPQTDSNKTEAPKTSDPSQLGFLGALLATSGAVITKLGFKRKKNDDEE